MTFIEYPPLLTAQNNPGSPNHEYEYSPWILMAPFQENQAEQYLWWIERPQLNIKWRCFKVDNMEYTLLSVLFLCHRYIVELAEQGLNSLKLFS